MDEIKINIVEMKTNLMELKDELSNQMQETMNATRSMTTEMKEEIKEMTKKVTFGLALLAKGNIIVVEGSDGRSPLNSAEMFGRDARAWKPLPSTKRRRSAATSFFYENQAIVSGGYNGISSTDIMERMSVNEEPKEWSNFPAKLPSKCNGHASVIYQNRLIITGE